MLAEFVFVLFLEKVTSDQKRAVCGSFWLCLRAWTGREGGQGLAQGAGDHPEVENHSKKCENGPKRAENDADDVAGGSEAAVDHLDVLEDADDVRAPAQTHADVVDDDLDVLEAGAGLLELRQVVLPHLFQQKNSTTKQLDLALFGKCFKNVNIGRCTYQVG